MSEIEKIQLFQDSKVRTAWDEREEKWYFSIVDVVSVLTDSADASAYWRKLKEKTSKMKEGGYSHKSNLLLVPRAGIEPARYCYHRILSPARLPIPPSGQDQGAVVQGRP